MKKIRIPKGLAELARFSLLIVALLLSIHSKAQTVNVQSDNVQWTATSLTDLNTGANQAHSCQFITHGVQRIDWVQNNGNVVINFTVSSISGSMTNAAAGGSLTYNISGSGLSGQLTVSKSGASTTIQLVLNGGTSPINLSYTISSYAKI